MKLPPVEFAYCNNFTSIVDMAPHKALYGQECHSPVLQNGVIVYIAITKYTISLVLVKDKSRVQALLYYVNKYLLDAEL